MEYKTTKKAVLNGYARVYAIPYCHAQNLLFWSKKVSYTTNVYGLATEIYELGESVAVATGYCPFGEEVDSELLAKLEKRAHQILLSGLSLDKTKKALEKLQRQIFK